MNGIHALDDLRDRCRVDDITGCWTWAGATTQSGSPSMWIPALDRVGSLGTLLSILTTGERPRKGACWMPMCGNRLCTRPHPEHRALGTPSALQKLNRPTLPPLHRARVARARLRWSKHYSPELADEIRNGTETLRSISDRIGLNPTMVSRIRRGLAWVDLSPFAALR